MKTNLITKLALGALIVGATAFSGCNKNLCPTYGKGGNGINGNAYSMRDKPGKEKSVPINYNPVRMWGN